MSKKIWEFIEKNKIWIFFIIITILAIGIRISVWENTFGDYEMFLEPWFNELKQRWWASCTWQKYRQL